MEDRGRRTGLGLLAVAGLAGAAWVRWRREQWERMGDGTMSMGDMTRKLAREQPPIQPGSDTLAWQPDSSSASGMSQSDSMSGQPLDSRMSQQFHQPAQGSEGGHATGVNVERDGEASRSEAP